MAPKIVNKEERKFQLATCALDVFAREGFEKASVALIASECGVGKGTVYEYFESKEAMFLEAVMVWMRQVETDTLTQLEKQLDPHASPLTQLKQYLLSTAESFLLNPYYKRMSVIMTHLMISHTRWLVQSEMLVKSTSSFRAMIQEKIHEAIDCGELASNVRENCEFHAINLIAGLDGIELHASISENYLVPLEQCRLYIETYLKGLQ